jgi:2-polyprenyl-6-methoxyphenol hydroxylase-like FAD-dependent oxidoreductase
MNSIPNFDIICIGGGLAGSALAKVMTERGYRVLVLERTVEFQDRVRGEATHPWGSWEAQQLGLYDLMLNANGIEILRTDEVLAPGPVKPRDNVNGTAFKLPRLCFCHSTMQLALIEAAQQAGAEVERGVNVTGIEPLSADTLPTVTWSSAGKSHRATARLIVGADGRGSQVRAWAGFGDRVRRDPACLLMAGVLLSGTTVERGASYAQINPAKGRKVILLPQGDGRGRAYLSWHIDTGAPRLNGPAAFQRFLDECIAMGTPPEHLAGAQQAGPLATFDCNEIWVEHPYKAGIALIGDAAANSDPTWGQGLALTLRDVRTLAEALSARDDWEAAAHGWAEEHDRYSGVIRTVNNCYADLFMDPTPAGRRRRDRALHAISQDSTRAPQHHFAGPDLPAPPNLRARFLAEDLEPNPSQFIPAD